MNAGTDDERDLARIFNNVARFLFEVSPDAQGDFEIEFKDPAAVATIGFEPIPVAKIGLYQDERRASWPVKREVRPVGLAHD